MHVVTTTRRVGDREYNTTLLAEVRRAFRPSAPVTVRALFAGRGKQMDDLMAVLGEVGQHAVVFGERGVGKTSLVSVVGDIFAGGSFLFVRRRMFALRALSQRGSAPVPS